ncbi:MAG: hypothetical protein V1728_00170 [Candidatus Micrarchaeota archaeon]
MKKKKTTGSLVPVQASSFERKPASEYVPLFAASRSKSLFSASERGLASEHHSFSSRLFFAGLLSLIFLSSLSGLLFAQDSKWSEQLPQDLASGPGSNGFLFANTPWAIANAGQWQPIGAGRSWVGLALLAITACFFANAFVYIVGHVLHIPSVERWAQSEFYQTTASALLVTGMGVMVAGGFALISSGGLLPQGTTTQCHGLPMDVWESGPFSIIQCKLEEKILYAETLYNQAYEQNKVYEPQTSLQIFVMGNPVWMGDWDNVLHTNMEQAHFIANRLVGISITLHATYMFADYLAHNMMYVFLPLGILLRIFPPLRGIGALFIAVALGFYIVFPISYVLLDPTTSKPNPEDIIPSPNARLDACYSGFSGIVSLNTQSNLANAQQTQAAIPNISEVASELTNLQIETFFNPLAALSITLIFISGVAPLLGGDSGDLLHFIAKTV